MRGSIMNFDEIERLAKTFGEVAQDTDAVSVTCESCTGGGISYAITSVAGSSAWFDRGFATYSNDAKRAHLGVRQATLLKWGAVSEQTAAEMVKGAMDRSVANVGVSVTGIAGPTGAVPGKPVGTVCFGFAYRLGSVTQVRTVTRHFDGDREQVRLQSIAFALEGLIHEAKERVGRDQD